MQLRGQRFQIGVAVEDPGDVRRTHLARIPPDLFQVRVVEAPETALDALFAELLGDELRVEVQKSLHVDDTHRLEGQPVRFVGREVAVDGQPRSLHLAHGRDPEVVAAAVARNPDPRAAQQLRRRLRMAGAPLRADHGVGVRRSALRQGGDPRHRVRHGRPVGQTPQQIERPRREVDRTLTLRDDRATLSRFRQADAARHAGQSATDDDCIESHFDAVFASSDNPHTLS